MKILFLMDSPEYLRFFDSVIGELIRVPERRGAGTLWCSCERWT